MPSWAAVTILYPLVPLSLVLSSSNYCSILIPKSFLLPSFTGVWFLKSLLDLSFYMNTYIIYSPQFYSFLVFLVSLYLVARHHSFLWKFTTRPCIYWSHTWLWPLWILRTWPHRSGSHNYMWHPLDILSFFCRYISVLGGSCAYWYWHCDYCPPDWLLSLHQWCS